MKILLYKTGSKTAFRKMDNPCEVIIPKGGKEVYILDMVSRLNKDGSHPVLGRYKLIKRNVPVWTDDTKSHQELLLKLVVEDLK